MHIYSLTVIVVSPAVISLIINLFIFARVRAASTRVQPQTASAQVNHGNGTPMRMSRRNMRFLRQMIFIFCMFVGGWGPVYTIVIVDIFVPIPPLLVLCLVLLAGLCLFAGVINLFKSHREVQQYLWERVGHCLRTIGF